MIHERLDNYRLILASGSPRRKQLLQDLGFAFEVQALDLDESYPPELKGEQIAIYLSELKARAFHFNNSGNKELLITADTIVWLDGEVLPKPTSEHHAYSILQKLSNKSHEVITGVSLRTAEKIHTFSAVTRVWFKALSDDEINFYIRNFHPFDKAGAYAIQEWIGYIGIEKIEGSYYNVMGLPVQKLYQELQLFLSA